MSPSVFCGEKRSLWLFDKVVTKEVAMGKGADGFNFSSGAAERHNVKNYIFEYQFEKAVPYHHYICSISVAEAGTFIDPKVYEKEYGRLKSEYMKSSPGRWWQQLLIDFPKVGKRARWGHITAGPGGTTFGLLFTTSDGMYDVKILISNLLPDTIEGPDLDIEQIAVGISDRYNKRVRGK